SQDIMDSAAMLVSRRALAIVRGSIDAATGRCAELAGEHRSTPMAARTLLQQAVPTTFGLKCACWLVALLDARAALDRIRRERLAVQLGGAAGTLAALGDGGLEVVRLYARELDLPEPGLPWHADRQRIAELGAALAGAAGAAAKIAGDIILLSQTEVAEVREGAGGASSTMPQKQNPAASVRAVACAAQTRGHASVLLAAVEGEHERAAGAWQSEWAALSGALSSAGGALANVAEALAGLEADPERMRQNLDATGGLIVAERVSHLLAPRVGRREAHEIVAAAVATGSFRWALVADERVGLTTDEVDELLDAAEYLGSAGDLVDRALERYEREEGGDA
ncbi:MAG TPA: lyase family protein, partial [Gaiellales bacterium]|nr:lyase family protein [Gaiellales bacterium]